jgi:hypothetical protein
VRKPDAYTGSRLGPSMTIRLTCQVRTAARTAANWAAVPVGWGSRHGEVRQDPAGRARAPVPDRTSARIGRLEPGPGQRKCISSTACHSMGLSEPETANGTVKRTVWPGRSGASRAIHTGTAVGCTVNGMSR